jgi:hypothetical protein
MLRSEMSLTSFKQDHTTGWDPISHLDPTFEVRIPEEYWYRSHWRDIFTMTELEEKPADVGAALAGTWCKDAWMRKPYLLSAA